MLTLLWWRLLLKRISEWFQLLGWGKWKYHYSTIVDILKVHFIFMSSYIPITRGNHFPAPKGVPPKQESSHPRPRIGASPWPAGSQATDWCWSTRPHSRGWTTASERGFVFAATPYCQQCRPGSASCWISSSIGFSWEHEPRCVTVSPYTTKW